MNTLLIIFFVLSVVNTLALLFIVTIIVGLFRSLNDHKDWLTQLIKHLRNDL